MCVFGGVRTAYVCMCLRVCEMYNVYARVCVSVFACMCNVYACVCMCIRLCVMCNVYVCITVVITVSLH